MKSIRKPITRIRIMALMLLGILLVASGCAAPASAPTAAATSAAAATPDATVAPAATASAAADATAAAGKVLRVGFECNSAPFCWTQKDDANGAVPLVGTSEYTYGFDVAIMKKICDLAGYKLEAYKIDWDGMLLGVQTGTYDAAISGISITEKRKVSMDFSDPYYVAGIVGLVRKDSKYASAKTLTDLSGARVTSMLNTIWYDMCQQVPNAVIDPALENLPAMLVAVQSGVEDLILVDEPTAMAATLANPDLVMIKPDAADTFKVSDEDVNLGIAIHKGNEDIVKAINAALAQIPEADRKAMLEEAIKVQPLAK